MDNPGAVACKGTLVFSGESLTLVVAGGMHLYL
jgi:hypothetical protein